MNMNGQLFAAILHADKKEASKCLSLGADINGLTPYGESVWTVVVSGGYTAVQLALELGADVRKLDRAERDALYWAIFSSDGDVAKMLIGHGADVRISDPCGTDETLLHIAASAGKTEVLKVLLQASTSGDLCKRNLFNRTPLDEALYADQKKCVAIIRQAIEAKSKGYSLEVPVKHREA
jgi:ankyrin repeat protein